MKKKRTQGRKPAVAIPPIPELAAHADAIRTIGRQSYEGAIEIGRRLVRCRELLKARRIWLAWIRLEFGWSRAHADNLMGLYLNRDKVRKFGSLGVPLSALYLLAKQPAKVLKIVDRHVEAGKQRSVLKLSSECAPRAETPSGTHRWKGLRQPGQSGPVNPTRSQTLSG